VLRAVIDPALRTRRAFRNWPSVCVIAGIGAPSGLPPQGGLPLLGRRRLRFVTRLGPVLETEAGNASPIIEVFAYGEYDVPIDWSGLRTIADVGAHVGAFTVYAAFRAPQARVVAVEPEPRNFRDLSANVERNGLGGRVEALNRALGSPGSVVELHVPPNRESGSTFEPGGAVVSAEGVSLEQLLVRLGGSVDLLKLDCEGAEWDLLDAAAEGGWQGVARIVMECHAIRGHSVDEMAERLKAEGFEVRILQRKASLVTWADEVALIWATQPSSQ
jgi:FkbM family methyltransferase